MRTSEPKHFQRHHPNKQGQPTKSMVSDRRLSRRANNLRELCQRYGDPEIIDRLEVSAARLTALTNGEVDINDELVMFIEDQLRLPSGWLDGIHIMALEAPLPDLPAVSGHNETDRAGEPALDRKENSGSPATPPADPDPVVSVPTSETQNTITSKDPEGPATTEPESGEIKPESTVASSVESKEQDNHPPEPPQNQATTEPKQESDDVYSARYRNLNMLVAQRGMRSALGRKLGLSGGLIKELAENRIEIEADRAREIEAAFGLAIGWLDVAQASIPDGALKRVHPTIRIDPPHGAQKREMMAPTSSPVSVAPSGIDAIPNATEAPQSTTPTMITPRTKPSPVAKALAKTLLDLSRSRRLDDATAYRMLGDILKL